ncbi:MAG: dihydroorotate dehydrogenase [Synergistaceae bacterium]|jgi:dihydroorotate dehydrogenase (NAD+) catalytic subunit|nr:dihydroorotate dehydrogenase [Synergistaceae bacterium]
MTGANGLPDKNPRAELETTLCGVRLKNPLIAASGTFGFGREFDELYDISCWGGISVKGLTLNPRLGNPPRRIAETASGMLNSVGLQNPGVDAFIKDELPWLAAKGTAVIANIAGATEDEYAEVARRLSDTAVDIVELNISCPNVKEGGIQFGTTPHRAGAVTAAVRKTCRQPLMVKLSPNVSDIAAIARAAEESGADAISLINTLAGMAIDTRRREPVLANVTGGLSGPAIKPVALRMVYETAMAVHLPVVGMGGIMTGEDAVQFMTAGASAVMVGTANVVDPFSGPRILAELEQYVADNDIGDLTALVGSIK